MSTPLTDRDPCAACGLEDVLQGSEPAAHWDTPHGSIVVAWSCSDECAAALEAHRDGGLLTVPARAAMGTFDQGAWAKALVKVLTPAQLEEVISGTLRLVGDRDGQVVIWNAAIDRANGYED